MKSSLLMIIVFAGSVYGQSGGAAGGTIAGSGASFQYIYSDNATGFKTLTVEGMSNTVVKGKPFSATEERHTVQVLGDGTRIENTDTNKIYRDEQGRTRIERPNGAVVVQGGSEGTFFETNADGQTSRRINTVFTRRVAGPEPANGETIAKLKAEAGANIQIMRAPIAATKVVLPLEKAQETPLGFQSINGVSAEGKRSVIEIPVGQIGNNRAIQVVSERWYSADLQMTVKTLNSDPRFGETTYELKNIVQGAQDPALFATPALPAPAHQ